MESKRGALDSVQRAESKRHGSVVRTSGLRKERVWEVLEGTACVMGCPWDKCG